MKATGLILLAALAWSSPSIAQNYVLPGAICEPDDDTVGQQDRPADEAAGQARQSVVRTDPQDASLPPSEIATRFDDWDKRMAQLRPGMTEREAIATMGSKPRSLSDGDFILSMNYGDRWLWFGKSGTLIGVYGYEGF